MIVSAATMSSSVGFGLSARSAAATDLPCELAIVAKHEQV
jgi:hypothetical protein